MSALSRYDLGNGDIEEGSLSLSLSLSLICSYDFGPHDFLQLMLNTFSLPSRNY